MKYLTLLLTTLMIMLNASINAQKVDWAKLDSLDPDIILRSNDRPPVQVLLLGTYHFDYPNLDAHKTDTGLQVDILSEKKQKEVRELVDVIERFKPTRIYIESQRQSFHDSLYNEYLQGRYTLERNEIYQLGYRIGKEMNHPKLYAVDANSFVSENAKKYTWIDSLWKNQTLVDPARDKYWNNRYDQFYNISDTLEMSLSLLENFLLMAQPKVLKRMQGAYLTGGFNTLGTAGPDAISMWWYNRNLRIFNNILTTKPSPNDRILIIFGNGHIPILKHCFESSPEFEVVELRGLADRRRG